MRLLKTFSYIFLFILFGLVIVLITVSICFGGETKQFKFFDFGTYTVPEDFPDKFLSFESRVLAHDSLVDGKAQLIMVGYRFSGSPGHLLVVAVVGYLLPNRDPVIVCVKTIVSINDKILGIRQDTTEYVDVQMFDTGRSSQVLVKVTKSLNLQKFINERIADLKNREI